MTTINLARQVMGPKRRPMVNSWDVFDTLITRFHLDPTDIFRLIDQRAPGSEFFERRRQAQADLDRIGRPYVVVDIYRQMVSAGMERALAMNLLAQELSVERWALFPIRAVIEMVQQGDLIVGHVFAGRFHL